MKIMSRINLISNISGCLVSKDLCAYLAYTYSSVDLLKSLAAFYKHNITLGITFSIFNCEFALHNTTMCVLL